MEAVIESVNSVYIRNIDVQNIPRNLHVRRNHSRCVLSCGVRCVERLQKISENVHIFRQTDNSRK